MTRFFDILFSLAAVIVLLPFMIPVMIALKLTGEHDIFYAQERVGKGGKTFKLLKFATMVRNSPDLPGGMFTSENDPRILPLGRFLRKTKINELPQLLNILAGQMSVIGYRPTIRESYEKYPEHVKNIISKYPPGLSGIGSIVFRNQDEWLKDIENKREFYDRVAIPYKGALEEWYADNRSLRLYFMLIFLTIDAVIKPDSRLWESTLKGLPPMPSELQNLIAGQA